MTGGIPMFQGLGVWKNCPSKTWGIWHFSSRICLYFATLLLLKSGTPLTTKTTLLKLARQQSLEELSLELWLSEAFKNGLLFGQIMPND